MAGAAPPDLPVAAALPELLAALQAHGAAVLTAEPGAGKTTGVPPFLLDAGLPGRIVMLEPRRLAARAAAARLAEGFSEEPGGVVGYRMRGETRVSARTRIEVVTEGVLTRMLQSDPGLEGIGTLIFDEFHERSLNADLGLALALEARAALRPDLRILVMSATMEANPVAALLGDAPVIVAPGRSFPVDIRHLPANPGLSLAGPDFLRASADLIARAAGETTGSVLAFLPGAGEIARVAGLLDGRLPGDMALLRLHGTMTLEAQRAAVARPASGRKLVLSTAIAETSLTIEGITGVVDCARARRARHDPGSGLTRLVTERVSRAEATQRAGRAGRLAPGVAWRLWSRGEEGALAAHPPPEIATADLAGLALDLALWGARGAEGLAFLTPPPEGALAEARALLSGLGALDASGAITEHGRAMAALPLHPRLSHMLLSSGKGARELAALIAARDPLDTAPGTRAPADLGLRWEGLRRRGGSGLLVPARAATIREEARRLPEGRGPERDLAEMAALAYPDRIGQARGGAAGRFLLSGGRGAVLDAADPLAGAPFLVATDLDGAGPEARIRQAVALDESVLRVLFADHLLAEEVCFWDARAGAVRARRRERLAALVLRDAPWPDCPRDARVAALLQGLRAAGPEALALPAGARRLCDRVEWLRAQGAAGLPDMSPQGLMASLGEWLAPVLPEGVSRLDDLAGPDLAAALATMLDWEARRLLDEAAPTSWVAPTGRRVTVEYGPEGPEVALRVQEVFGLAQHPCIGPARLPLRMVLLSPAGRPVQVTADLPGFWASSYADVRRDMRGRYPRHPWPEDPAAAPPTTRAKPRG